MKSARDRMDMHAAYQEVGTYRAAAADLRHQRQDRQAGRGGRQEGRGGRRRRWRRGRAQLRRRDRHHRRAGREDRRPHLGQAAPAGGAGRRLRGLGAELPPGRRRGEGEVAHRAPPGAPARGVGAGRHARVRLGRDRTAVRLLRRAGLERGSASSTSPTTWGPRRRMAALAQCIEILGGVPKTLLDRPHGVLKGGTVAGLVIPTPAYVRFVTHYGIAAGLLRGGRPRVEGPRRELGRLREVRPHGPRRAERRRPASTANARGRAVVRRGERPGALGDHGRPRRAPRDRAPAARRRCRRCGPGIGKVVHPQGRQAELRPLRLGPLLGAERPHRPPGRAARGRRHGHRVVFLGEIIATHDLVAPGETAVCDDHYGGPRPAPARAVRPKTASREGVLRPRVRRPRPSSRGRPPPGRPRSPPTSNELCAMEAAHGTEALVAAVATGGRVRRASGPPTCARSSRPAAASHGPGAPGDAAHRRACRAWPIRSLDDYAIGSDVMSTSAAAARRPTSKSGFGGCALGAMRRLVPELLVVAKTQRWTPRGVPAHPRRGRDRLA